LRSRADGCTGFERRSGIARQKRVKKRRPLVCDALTPLSGARRPGFAATATRKPLPAGADPMADLVFVVLTVVLFAALTVLIRAVERW
jgi:hypothetical protein